MQCSFCGNHLIQGLGKRVFETLGEHVCDPNGDHETPPRDFFICQSRDTCESHKLGAFWDEFGDLYTRKYFRHGRGTDIPYMSAKNSPARYVEVAGDHRNIPLLSIGKYSLIKQVTPVPNSLGVSLGTVTVYMILKNGCHIGGWFWRVQSFFNLLKMKRLRRQADFEPMFRIRGQYPEWSMQRDGV